MNQKQDNIRIIKEYLQALLEIDYEKFETFVLIGIEHRLFYDICLPLMRMSQGDKNE